MIIEIPRAKVYMGNIMDAEGSVEIDTNTCRVTINRDNNKKVITHLSQCVINEL